LVYHFIGYGKELYLSISHLLIDLLFVLYHDFGKHICLTGINCNETSSSGVSILKYKNSVLKIRNQAMPRHMRRQKLRPSLGASGQQRTRVKSPRVGDT